MFKLTIPITKSFQKKNGKFIVEGIASDPTIDRDEERFDEEAISKMVDGVNEGSLPIRIEHEDKVYTDVGVWTKASMVDDKLYVKGEIDTEMSLGKDISVLLKRGTPLCLSVGGTVLEAVYEFVADLGKNIKIYKDVILEEISVVKNPSNYNTSLSMAKSIDWKKDTKEVEYTTQAQQLIDLHKGMGKVTEKEFVETTKDEPEIKAKKGSFNDWMAEIEPKVIKLFKDCYYDECDECDNCCDEYRGITPEDLKLIAQLTTIMSEVDLPDDNTWPAIFDTDDYWDNLTEEMQIVLYNRSMTMPHHNTDFSVNKELLLYQLKKVVDGVGWYTPKEYTAIINHLYIHLKKLQLVKSKTMHEKPKDSMSDIKKHVKEQNISKEQLNLLQSCHDFSIGKSSVAPTNEGKEMTKEEIAKCVEAYKELLDSPHFNQIINQSEIMGKTTKKAEDETKVEETPVKKEEETTKEETETTEVEETETSEEKEEEETTEETTEEEEVPEKEEETSEEETTEEETDSEEEEEETEEEALVEDAEVEKKLAKSITKSVEKGIVKKFDKSLKKLTEIVDTLVTKSAEDKTATEITGLKKSLETVSETLEIMAKASLGRKSYATTQVVEKSFQEGALNKTETEKIEEDMKNDVSFADAYKSVLAERNA